MTNEKKFILMIAATVVGGVAAEWAKRQIWGNGQ